MASMLPMVNFLKKKGFPKILAVLIPYFSVLILFFVLIFPLIPFFSGQVESLIVGFPKYLDKTASLFGITIDPKELQSYINSQMSDVSKNAVDVTSKVFGGIFSSVTIFVVSFYLLMYNDVFKKFIANLFHKQYHDRVLRTVSLVNEKLGAWLQGQMLLCLIIGTLSGVSLTLLGVPYALPLALIAGLLEAVPTLGPIISAIPAVIVALTISVPLALAVVVTYIVIQMLENQFIVPKVMQRAVGLNPVIVIIGINIGAKLMGVIGALLAIPFITLIIVIYKSIEAEKAK